MNNTVDRNGPRLSTLCCLVVLVISSGWAQAQTPEAVEREQLLQAQERQRLVQEQQRVVPEVRLPMPAGEAIQKLPVAETPAFAIRRIELEGEEAQRFGFALQEALQQTGLQAVQEAGAQRYVVQDAQASDAGVMLGAQGINMLMKAAQNAVIARGYTTSRVLAQPQDLSQGVLTLTIVPGRIRHIKVDQSDNAHTHAERATLFSALPMKSGDILNLRDIEQTLENLKRLPTVEADIQIAPADSPNQSDLNIQWRQRTVPLRLSVGLDDSGSKATGKYQGTATVAVDHPLRLNDLLYLSYGAALSGYDKVYSTDAEGRVNGSHHGKSKNWALHYSVPYGYWELALNASSYDYDQAVAGVNQVYRYRGHSNSQEVKLSRVLHRDHVSKTSAYLKGWHRQSDNFIDDAEIEAQRRETGGYELGVGHKRSIGQSQISANVAFKRGTGAFNAMRAPEEAFGEGTSRMQLITADVDVVVPWQIEQTPISFGSSWHAQWNKTPLTPQDRLAIGGRSTVRGFDGNYSLSAERGWYSRNELAVTYRPGHQAYLALDAGHVAGASAQYLLGQTLVGTAVGLRGQFKLGGQLSYDLFAGAPLRKPQGYVTKHPTLGFNLNYTF